MGKNKKNPQPINIQNLNMEIDYDKLAEAIVNAQAKSEKKENSNHSKIRSKAMKLFNGGFYAMIVLFSILIIDTIWRNCYVNNTIPLYGCILMTIVFVFLCVFAFLCLNETYADKENETKEHFNVNISLLALIVAILALYKGIG